jgi:hypothetical protein
MRGGAERRVAHGEIVVTHYQQIARVETAVEIRDCGGERLELDQMIAAGRESRAQGAVPQHRHAEDRVVKRGRLACVEKPYANDAWRRQPCAGAAARRDIAPVRVSKRAGNTRAAKRPPRRSRIRRRECRARSRRRAAAARNQKSPDNRLIACPCRLKDAGHWPPQQPHHVPVWRGCPQRTRRPAARDQPAGLIRRARLVGMQQLGGRFAC